jgi:L-histidine N-alpha-methyltransferase
MPDVIQILPPFALGFDPAEVREVAEGLSRTPRELPPRYFYDERGSRLFEEITQLPEYYLTRTERSLLQRWMPEWIGGWAPRALVELGAGSGEKTRIVLDAIAAAADRAVYVPVDVSAEFLEETAERLGTDYPTIDIVPVVADITDAFPLPAVELLLRVRNRMMETDRFLMGVDLRKDPRVIEAAYNDTAGVTAEFNRNMLRVVNAAAGTDFDPEAWEHRAFYDRTAHWIEMHLVSARDQAVSIPGHAPVRFAAGQSIRTEISAKHDHASVDAMFAAAGLAVERWETDADGLYALTLAAPV